MRRDTQLWIGGIAIVSAGMAMLIYLNQKDQITDQNQAINEQALMAQFVKERSAEEESYRQQEAAFGMELNRLNAEQATNTATTSADRATQAASERSALNRQGLESKIQDLKSQQAQRNQQNDCRLIQLQIKIAEAAKDSGQAKALDDRWNATCSRG